MLLRIQRDESLRSYVERNHFINRYGPLSTKPKLRTALSYMRGEILEICNLMGWYGCYGFNRLLHNHTYYPQKAFLHDDWDESYSEDEYYKWVGLYESLRTPLRYCPECVKEDLIDLGFSYWRRELHPDINVCAKHNVYLESHCPYCMKPICEKNHKLDIMWKGCNGSYLHETISRPNQELLELKRAIFFRDLYSFDSVVSIEAVRAAIIQRSIVKKPIIKQDLLSATSLWEVIKILKDKFCEDWGVTNRYAYYHDVWGAILALYDDFEDFISHVKCYDYKLRKVQSLWSTYTTRKYDFVQFTREDYVYGVGHWSSVFSAEKAALYRGEDLSGRPYKFPCCNEVESLYYTRRLHATPIGRAHPNIPILGIHPSES